MRIRMLELPFIINAVLPLPILCPNLICNFSGLLATCGGSLVCGGVGGPGRQPHHTQALRSAVGAEKSGKEHVNSYSNF